MFADENQVKVPASPTALDASRPEAPRRTVGRRVFVGGAVATGVWSAPTVAGFGRVAAAASSCSSLENVALGKATTMSSGPWPGLPAEKGVNGNTSGAMSADRNGFHTWQELNAWWEVDLGGIFDIAEVRLWNRGDCCQSRIQNVAIDLDGVSAGVAWGTIGRPTIVPLTTVSRGQVVRLTNGHPASQWFHLAEVEVIGCPA